MLLVIYLMISVQVAAASSGIGVGVSPRNMSFELSPATSAEQSLYVINTGSENETYEIFVDNSTYDNWFTFSPSSFDLKTGEIKEVKVTLEVPISAESNAECKIKIPCTLSGSDIGTEITVPVHIEIFTFEGNFSQSVSSGSSSAGEGEGSSESASDSEIKDIVQRFVKNNSDVRFNFTQNITYLGEALKDSGENLEVIATKSFDNVIKNFDNVIKNFNDTIENFNNKIKNFNDTIESFNDTIENFDNVTKRFDNVTKRLDYVTRNVDNATENIDENSSVLYQKSAMKKILGFT